ncbi:MAG: hypothetical protein P4L50_21800 [Anaerolineaceae bacterium]|nr:hypothetical protein [Anaerolineaceae bacterium]
MKRLFLYPLGLFLLVSMACALLPGSTSTQNTPVPPVPPTVQPAVQPALPTAAVLPTQELQPTAVQPAVVQPTVVQPTSAPTKPSSFTENFDIPDQNMTDVLTTTTQARAGHMYSNVGINDGFLIFNLQDKETYDYSFYKNPMPADVTMELKFYNTGQIVDNGVALICRANSDFSSWIEFRVSSQGNYDIFRYDKSLAAQYKHTYIDYLKGVTDKNVISPFPTIENDIKASCIGPNLTFTFNDKQTVTTMKNDIMDGGYVGLGAMSGDLIPYMIKVDSFTTSAK